ncbi:glutamine synthetase [Cryobacterium sp. 1639]|uniref:glutamine synthetase n=1 Tax=Cryobacterium inferilacus TaxID=2866629 RepID=UPI001C729F42|nr:glutamine synthetase [Cryobacterium sp. 1639]MBX0301086.1 glutamine synthetase [Cryobacterium sp. 1639]
MHCCWGLENREAALTFCAATAGNPRGAHLEVKPIDPSANPHLSSTAILGAALAGIRARSPLLTEVRVNPAKLSDADAHAAQLALLPTSPTEMLRMLASSSLATEIYGEQSDEATTERLRFVWSA